MLCRFKHGSSSVHSTLNFLRQRREGGEGSRNAPQQDEHPPTPAPVHFLPRHMSTKSSAGLVSPHKSAPSPPFLSVWLWPRPIFLLPPSGRKPSCDWSRLLANKNGSMVDGGKPIRSCKGKATRRRTNEREGGSGGGGAAPAVSVMGDERAGMAAGNVWIHRELRTLSCTRTSACLRPTLWRVSEAQHRGGADPSTTDRGSRVGGTTSSCALSVRRFRSLVLTQAAEKPQHGTVTRTCLCLHFRSPPEALWGVNSQLGLWPKVAETTDTYSDFLPN